MTTKNKFSENDFNATIGNTVLCDGFLIPMTDFVLEQLNEQNSRTKPMREVFNSLEKYAKFLKQPLKLEMFVPCDEDGNVLGEPEIYSQWVCENFNDELENEERINQCKDYHQAKEKVLFEGFKIYDYKLNVFFYLGRRKTLSYDKKRKDFITIGLLLETVEDLINISSQIKLSQTALNAIFG